MRPAKRLALLVAAAIVIAAPALALAQTATIGTLGTQITACLSPASGAAPAVQQQACTDLLQALTNLVSQLTAVRQQSATGGVRSLAGVVEASTAVPQQTSSTNSSPMTLLQPPSSQPVVGVYYFATYYTNIPGVTNYWQNLIDFVNKTGATYQYWVQKTPTMDESYRKPLIGYYDDRNVSVMENQIDQASSRGIDYFNFYWYWDATSTDPALIAKSSNTFGTDWSKALGGDGQYAFMNASNKFKMHFMVTIFSSSYDKNLVLSKTDEPAAIADLFATFADPQYLRIDARPVLAIGDGHGIGGDAQAVGAGTPAVIDDFISQLDAYAASHGMAKPLVLLGPGAIDSWQSVRNIGGYQCFLPNPGQADYDKDIASIRDWFAPIESLGQLSPCMASDFDARPEGTTANIQWYINHSPQKFYNALVDIRNWQEEHMSPISNILTLYAWNEWYEGGIIEPNARDGFTYLDLIERAYRTMPLTRYHNANGHRVTTVPQGSDMQAEGSWQIYYQNDVNSTRIPIFECQTSDGHYFVSKDTGCGGSTKLGLLGYLAATANERVGLSPLYRCSLGADKFVSSDPHCENAYNSNTQTDELLGYAYLDTVVAPPTPGPTLSAAPPSANAPLTILFNVSRLNVHNSYTLDFGDSSQQPLTLNPPPCAYGVDCSNSYSANTSHIYQNTGTYTASLYQTGQSSSLATATVTATAPAISPDGTTLLPTTGGSLTTSDGTWTFSSSLDANGNNIILLNGTPTPYGGAGVKMEVASGGHLYAYTKSNTWYLWHNSTDGGYWTVTTDPSASNSKMSYSASTASQTAAALLAIKAALAQIAREIAGLAR